MTMAEIKKLLELMDDTPDDRVDIKNKVIYFQGYTFMFRDHGFRLRESYVVIKFSSKVTSAGFWRKIIDYSVKNLKKIKKLNDINLKDTKYDFCYGGSLKTIFPNLKFGGDEMLYFVWMFIKTPEGFMFPATFYFGPSGTSIGGWSLFDAKEVFPPEFYSVINFSPFDFSHDELNAFVEALELSLMMVPMTDYYGVFLCDDGYTIMGIKKGIPYLLDLGWSYDKGKIDKYLEIAQFNI